MQANKTDKELWIPSAAQKEQKVLSRLRRHWRLKAQLTTDLKDKTMWDWLPVLLQIVGLFVILAALFISTAYFINQLTGTQDRLAGQTNSNQQHLVQQLINEEERLIKQININQGRLIQQEGALVDQAHEQILTDYLNYMSNLLPSIKAASPDSIARMTAQIRTKAVFYALKSDVTRRTTIIQFLHDSGLILNGSGNTKEPIIHLNTITLGGLALKQAILNGANFDDTFLSGANFNGAILSGGSFRGAVLTKANFNGANLQNVDFSGANLTGADFTNASMKGANVSGANMKNAKLKGVIW